eukprot:gene16686-22124_t
MAIGGHPPVKGQCRPALTVSCRSGNRRHSLQRLAIKSNARGARAPHAISHDQLAQNGARLSLSKYRKLGSPTYAAREISDASSLLATSSFLDFATGVACDFFTGLPYCASFSSSASSSACRAATFSANLSDDSPAASELATTLLRRKYCSALIHHGDAIRLTTARASVEMDMGPRRRAMTSWKEERDRLVTQTLAFVQRVATANPGASHLQKSVQHLREPIAAPATPEVMATPTTAAPTDSPPPV